MIDYTAIIPIPVGLCKNRLKEERMKKGAIIICAAVTSVMIFACKGPQPKNCIEGDCLDGKGTMKYVQGKYTGEFDKKQKNGQGTFDWTNGSKYIGQWKDNKRNGQGVYTYKDGEKYTGEFKDDLRNGKGIYEWKNGDKYDGEWKDGNMTGKGVYTFKDGRQLQGVFENNKFMKEEKLQEPKKEESTEKKEEKK